MPDSTYFDDQSLNKLDNKYEDIAGNPFVDALGFAKQFAGGVVRRAQQAVSSGYAQADRALGGWLPGGGTPNPLTSGYDRPSGDVAAIARSVGVSPDSFKVAYLNKKRPLLNQASYDAGSANGWRNASYAIKDPFVGNVIGLAGSGPPDKTTIIHELGHLQGAKTADFGRALQTASNFTGGFFPLKYAAGLALSGDAAEEDKAERFTMMHTGTTTTGSPILADGTSTYGNSLRQQGETLKQEVMQPFTNLVSDIQSGYRNVTQASTVKDWIESERSGKLERLKYAHTLKNKLLNSGYTEDDLYKMFTDDLKRNPPKPLY